MGGTSESVKKVGDLHPLDEALFKEYPAPLWESAMRLHHTLINHTTPFFGPLLYWLIRAIGGIDVIEIFPEDSIEEIMSSVSKEILR